MKQHNLSPINVDGSYSYETNDGNEKQISITPKELNKMSVAEVNSLVNNLLETNPDNTVNIDGGVPFVIIGSGITPDFIYPMVGFNNVNPNVDKEFIVFPNTTGYERILDGYAASPVENYLVCRILDGTSLDSILRDINT